MTRRRVSHVRTLKLLLLVTVGWALLDANASCAHAQGHPPQEAARRMTLPDGLEVTLFASEPDVRQPIFCKCDERGRLWTIQYLQYPNPAGLKRVKVDRYSRTEYDRKPEPPPRGPRGADRITILEDSNGDGRADRVRDFVTGLNLCTGVEFGHGGVYVLQAPYLLFYPDRNRDDVPDSDPDVLLDGFGLEDAQSLANHLTWGPDGWLYGLNGSTTTCRIRGIEFQQGVWRYHPMSRDFELFCEGGGNLFGLTFDRVGRMFFSSNGGVFYHGVQGAYYEKNFGKHGPLHNPHAYGYFTSVKCQGQTGRPNPGATVYLGHTFPAPFRDALLVSDFLTHTCSWWKIEPRGATVAATLGGHLLDSHDTWFGATDLCLGPDGAVYVCDFHDQRTAHPDPDATWDTSNGRIYRIQAKNAPPADPFDLTKKSSRELVELLTHPNGWFAAQARRILAERRDEAMWPVLRARAADQQQEALSLQAIWALHASGGFTREDAQTALKHASPHVRAWTVRLLGDTRSIAGTLVPPLVELARTDPSIDVRAQLASTAQRLPSDAALAILESLLARPGDDDDPYMPWLIWWALEAHAISARDEVLRRFARPESWQHAALRGHLRRLMRRYAAQGDEASDLACAGLWASAPDAQRATLWTALEEGLRQRPRQKERSRVSMTLRELIGDYWRQRPEDSLRLRVALEAELEAAHSAIVAGLSNDESVEQRRGRLELLAEYGRDDCVPRVLELAGANQPESIRRTAIAVLQRFARDDIAQTLVRDYSSMSPALKSTARETLFRRASSSVMFLREVDAGRVAVAEVPLEQLRPLADFANPTIDSLVRKHWGNLSAATPEERLADVRRFSNDLRAAAGNPTVGKPLFVKHCGVCHKLRGEGQALGPDLSGTVQGDLQALLVNIVDPSAVVRREFMSYVAVDKSGGVRTGLLAEQDAASVTLLDARNQRVRLARDEIEELRESTVSLMPDRLLHQLTPQELRDLFAHLRSTSR